MVESKRQCRFCRHFREKINVEFVSYRCHKGNFSRVIDMTGYPEKRAETCSDFELDTRPKSTHTNPPSDSSSLFS